LVITKAALYDSLPQEVKFRYSFSTFSFIHLNAGSYLSELQTEAKDNTWAMGTPVCEVIMHHLHTMGIEMSWDLLDIWCVCSIWPLVVLLQRERTCISPKKCA